jgi:hypothetical protein
MRSFLSLSVFALVALFQAQASAASVGFERSVGTANVVRVANLPVADLVLLDAGYESGLRQGMVCSISRGSEMIGELLLVDLRLNAANALITDLSGHSVRPGDQVAVKTVSSRN